MSAESNDKRGKAAVFSLPVISKIKNEYDLFCTEANANLNFKEFFEGQKKREKSLFLEFLRLRSKYGASVEDYLLYEFYRKSNREINTYITFKRRGQLYRAADKKDSLHYFGNKKDFFEKFGRYMQQDCIFAADEKDKDTFVRFCEGKDEIVIKPVWGQRGQGVHRLSVSDKKDVEKIWNDYFNADCEYEVDRVIRNCPEFESFHPQSLNTVRLSILLDKSGKPHIMAATVRTGSGDNRVDNGHSEGIYAAVDVANGIVMTNGFNSRGQVFPVHPDSGISFSGTQIPHWKDLVALASEVALVEPTMRYIGWDFVLNESYNWILLEGNEPGGIDVHQKPLGKGLYRQYAKMIYG